MIYIEKGYREKEQISQNQGKEGIVIERTLTALRHTNIDMLSSYLVKSNPVKLEASCTVIAYEINGWSLVY